MTDQFIVRQKSEFVWLVVWKPAGCFNEIISAMRKTEKDANDYARKLSKAAKKSNWINM